MCSEPLASSRSWGLTIAAAATAVWERLVLMPNFQSIRYWRALKGLAVAGPEPDRPWTNESLSGLIEHISNKHHVFICEEGPHIQASAAKVVGAHGQNHPELLEAKQIFDDLSNELSVHS
jgi:iron-sulfur cluster repair protein YtfE (RIC family)